MSAQVQGQPASPRKADQGQPTPGSPGRLRARLRAAQAAARDVTAAAAESSARVGKRVREDNEDVEPAPSTQDSSKRPATNSRRRASSDGDDERRRRLSSADYSEDVEEVDERIDYVEDVEDEDEDDKTPRRKRRPARRDTGDASALDSKTSLANRFSRIKY